MMTERTVSDVLESERRLAIQVQELQKKLAVARDRAEAAEEQLKALQKALVVTYEDNDGDDVLDRAYAVLRKFSGDST